MKAYKLTLTTLDGEVIDTYKVALGNVGDDDVYVIAEGFARAMLTSEIVDEIKRADARGEKTT